MSTPQDPPVPPLAEREVKVHGFDRSFLENVLRRAKQEESIVNMQAEEASWVHDRLVFIIGSLLDDAALRAPEARAPESEGERLARGHAMHDAMTGAPEVWSELDADERENWCATADEYHRLTAPPTPQEASPALRTISPAERAINEAVPALRSYYPREMAERIERDLRATSEVSPVLREALLRLAYPTGQPFSEPGRLHTCPVCRAHEMWPFNDGERAHFADCWLAAALLQRGEREG
jgi:hypothetical protein